MAINKNHEFEELNGVKCGIAEKNVPADRANFLKALLEFNNYEVVVAASPPPKVVAAPKPAATTENQPGPEAIAQPEPPPLPATFTVGVTDTTFNPINAIFGRMLKTTDGHIVTLAYWQQKESNSHDEIPYYDQKI